MKQIDYNIEKLALSNKVNVDYKREEIKTLQNILEFCELVREEKNGLLFIEKMIKNLIIANIKEISENV
jgi:hypothetical protein